MTRSPSRPTHQLAAIRYERGFDIDRLLIDVCQTLSAQRVRIGGLVQLSTGERGGNCAATTHVMDLKTRATFDIWEDRGPCARGCRLDEGGLSHAEPVLERAIEECVDLLIINRFGRAESLGRGLRPYFESAISAGIPVLSAVRSPYDAAWRDFHCGLGVELPCSVSMAVAWHLDCSLSYMPQLTSQQP